MATHKPHWLAPAGKNWTPNIVVTFDTETVETADDGGLVQRLRCWDARTRVRHHLRPTHWELRDEGGEDAADLASVVEYASTLDKEAWVFAHNLGFDLAVTSLPFVLIHRGWEVEALHLGDESTWWIMRHGARKLVLSDSWSWVRCDLATVGRDIGRRKVPLPLPDDPLEVWHRRCRHDVVILDEMMCSLLDWWDAQPLGRFGITGSGCGWSAMRSHIKAHQVLVGPDPGRTEFERSAIHGGRKEVYAVGRFEREWFADYDFVAAYPTTVAAFPLPEVPRDVFAKVPDELAFSPPLGRDVIAEVTITTDRPCAPVKIDGEVWWPTGTFRTVLAGPEIRYAKTVARSVVLGAGRSYKVGYSLAEWAGWCLTLQQSIGGQVPPIVSRVAKAWGRSVIGRFAARTTRIVSERPSQHLGWHLETGHDLETGAAIEVLSIGGKEITMTKDVDATDCFPAVLAFVEAHCRVALAHMLDTREPSRLMQCNTDGWWERRAVRSASYQVEDAPKPYRVVRKALERSLVVLGPNHVETPSERRYAGIPRAAELTERETFAWHDWPGFRWQLEHGEAGTYHRPLRDAILDEHYVRRWVLDNGDTLPATAKLAEDGTTALCAWSETIGRLGDDVLAASQVDRLADLVDEPSELLQPRAWDGPRLPGRGHRRKVRLQ